MKYILVLASMLFSLSAMAKDEPVAEGERTSVVKLEFPLVKELQKNEVEVAASTVCINGKLFAVVVQRDNSSRYSSGSIAMTQVMDGKAGKVSTVDCVTIPTALEIERERKKKK